MLIFDMEVYRYNWILCWLDCKTRKLYSIHDDKEMMQKFYEHYKNEIWVGYNSRQYDIGIVKAILCDFTAWEMNDWIINKGRKIFEFSTLLNNFPILNYDCMLGFRSLKELEAFQGHSIVETGVPFDIDRPLTEEEIQKTITYCKTDVWETFQVFVETKAEFESHVGLIKEFNLPINMINKTKAQISAEILGAVKLKHNDEFDIKLPDNLELGKYTWIKDHFLNWAKNSKNYEEITLKTEINGVPHTFGVGGLHGSQDGYMGDGYYLMADASSYYPAGMIEYDYLSRNVLDKHKFRAIRDERIVMKARKDPRQAPRKIVLNSTFGASKDPYNKLYDPLQANNLCIANQLFIVDLLEKLEGKCELIQTNTDGILVKLYSKEDKDAIINICHEWEKRTRFELEFDEYSKVIQRDVNNYIIIDNNGHVKRKGSVVKKLSPLDNDLPIVNKAVVDYFVYNVPVFQTIMASDKLIDFQKITKISGKYEYGFKEDATGRAITFYVPITKTVKKQKVTVKEPRTYVGYMVNEKVHRCFASKDLKDGALYKKSKVKSGIDKTPSTPDHCRIINEDITEMGIPSWLDKQWYIDLAKNRIEEFVN